MFAHYQPPSQQGPVAVDTFSSYSPMVARSAARPAPADRAMYMERFATGLRAAQAGATSFSGGVSPQSGSLTPHVDVYGYNVEGAMRALSALVGQGFSFLALDTEFPGIVLHDGDARGFELVAANCAVTDLVQLGVSVFNSDGLCAATFQFHFAYDGPFNADSLRMLVDAGIDLNRNRAYGIAHAQFGELLRGSGLVGNRNVMWVFFHGCFDAAYVLKTLMDLPADFETYGRAQRALFPYALDLKTLATAASGFHGGLERLAGELGVQRVGQAHQAGSDSRLTGDAFFALLEMEHAQRLYHAKIGEISGY